MSSNMSVYPEPSRNVQPVSSSFAEVQTGSPALRWWYSISAPRGVSADASLEQREVARRGRVASLILPVIIVLALLPIPAALALGNPIFLSILALVFLLDVVALFGLNRTGHVTTAGILVVVGLELGVGISVLSLPGGLEPSNLPLFDLMVQALVVAVAMLAPPIVFLIAGINILFIIIVLYSNIPNPDLAHIVATSAESILPAPITLQVAIAWFTFVLLRSTNQAIRRADHAEELATLSQQNIELQQRELERTHQIEQGIEYVLATMVRFSNGDVLARAPESQDNVLWKIGRSLNILLARQKDYQRKSWELEQARKQIEVLQTRLLSSPSSQGEFEQTREAAARLQEAIRIARRRGTTIALPSPSGTIIDGIAMELGTIPPQQNRYNQR